MQAVRDRCARANATRIRSILIGSGLFAATTLFCLWQNTRVAALFDLSYLLDSSWRISLGQLPYRDFPFAHAPGTFLLHAALINIFGRVYWPHIVCAALESGAATLLTWRILLRILHPLRGSAWWIAALLAATLVSLGIYSIYPHTIYDGDSIFTVLIALYLVMRAAKDWDDDASAQTMPRSAAAVFSNLAAGAACVFPVLFKQNIGLAFLAVVLPAVAAIVAVRLIQQKAVARPMWFLCGVLSAIGFALIVIHLTVGLENYRYWTMTFAAARRLPGIATLFGVYHQASLLWTVPAAFAGYILVRAEMLRNKRLACAAAFLLLAAPFLWAIAGLALATDSDDRADQLLALWPHLLALAAVLVAVQLWRLLRGSATPAEALPPLIVFAAIHGTFLSQQLWGSTYALWPLLLFLITMLLLEVRPIAVPLAVTIAVTLLICGTLYAASLERVDYIHLDGTKARATLPPLRDMATPGPWLPEFEAMVRFTNAEIPPGDGIVLVPGEDPFYFATGRTPSFPVLLTDLATDPYTPAQTVSEIHARNIRWLIVKRDLQLNAPPDYETSELLQALEKEFVLDQSLPGYDIYRRP